MVLAIYGPWVRSGPRRLSRPSSETDRSPRCGPPPRKGSGSRTASATASSPASAASRWAGRRCSAATCRERGSVRRTARRDRSAHDAMFSMYALVMQAYALAYTGDVAGAPSGGRGGHAPRIRALRILRGTGVHGVGVMSHLAAGDATAAWEAFEAALNRSGMDLRIASTYNWAALAALACGDLSAARRWADDVVPATQGVRPVAHVGVARVRRRSRRANPTPPNATPTTRSIWRPGSGATSPFRSRSTAWRW